MAENVDLFFGFIDIREIENIYVDDNDVERVSPFPMTDSNIKFNQYADCQQIVIWLPDSGMNYETMTLIDIESNTEIWKKEISEILNGSIQIIIDSVSIPPGNYNFFIHKKDGFVHKIHFLKSVDFQKSVKEEVTVEPDLTENNEPIVYRDGFGNEIPNEDLDLRNKVVKKLFDKLTRKVEYQNQGRGGYAILTYGQKIIKFEMEYGGGDCIFILSLPTPDFWETHSDISIEERNEIISFVAETVLRDQTFNAYYVISGNDISYFKRNK